MQTRKLSFFPTPAQLARLVSNNVGFYLDSADANHAGSNYSYVGIAPDRVLQGSSAQWKGLPEIKKTSMGPYSLMSGWVGYAGYECGSRHVTGKILKGDVSPDFWFGYFSRILVLDHQKNEAHLCYETDVGAVLDILNKIPAEDSPSSGSSIWVETPDYDSYATCLSKVKKYLEAGDAYQVNLTRRFVATTTIDGAQTYLALRRRSAGPYSALINTGEIQIYSMSPELFFECDGKTIITRPIKGTVNRLGDPKADEQARESLKQSAKANAELLMITDLERNDLGRVSEYGSVMVDKLLTVETYASVHHLVSTVRSKLKEGVGVSQAFDALFPGGSITGAPKKRAMEIIAEIETYPRNVYTGAIGFVSSGGQAMFNIPIRTVIRQGDLLHLHSGGGIVIDSEARAEYEEMWMKIKGICEALGLNVPEF